MEDYSGPIPIKLEFGLNEGESCSKQVIFSFVDAGVGSRGLPLVKFPIHKNLPEIFREEAIFGLKDHM